MSMLRGHGRSRGSSRRSSGTRCTPGCRDWAGRSATSSAITLAVHQHADSHIDTQAHLKRVIEGTDPEVVQLCLDTGHISYCGGDNLDLIARYPQRIAYVHLKQVAPAVMEHVAREGLSFAQAVRLGSMIEPPLGNPDMPPILDALAGLDRDLFAIVEQDLFPCDPDVPLPIATRTRQYFEACGIGPGRLAARRRLEQTG